MKIKLLGLIFITLFFNGFIFGTPKIDSSSDVEMKESIQKVKNSLDESKQQEFDEAIKIVMFSQIDMKAIFASAMQGKEINQEKIQNDMKKSLHGKTGLEVIALATEKKKQRKIENERRKNEQLTWKKKRELEELKTLKDKKKKYDIAKEKLSQFKVISSTFYKKQRNKYSTRMVPIIELVVKNESEYPVSKIYCKGIIQSEGRSVPWLVENFNYKISGGLEPNETRDWILSPNMFSEWGRVEAPVDALFTVKIIAVNDAAGKELYSIRDFTDDEKDRLVELEYKYEDSETQN